MSRIYVQEMMFDKSAEVLRSHVEQLQVGSGLDEQTTLGSFVSQAQLEEVFEHVKDAVSKGTIVISGGVALPSVDRSHPSTGKPLNASAESFRHQILRPDHTYKCHKGHEDIS